METLFPIGMPAAVGYTNYNFFELRTTRHWHSNAPLTLPEMKVGTSGTEYPTVPMTSNIAPIPLVASANSESSPHLAYRAFNHDDVTFWNSAQSADSSGFFSPSVNLEIDLGSGNEIPADVLKLTFRHTGALPRTLRNFTFHGSNNGTDWDLLLTVVDQPEVADGTEVSYPL